MKRLRFKFGIEYAIRELTSQAINLVTEAGKKGVALGVSGGVDSATALSVWHEAFARYNAHESEEDCLRVICLLIPSDANDPSDYEDGVRVVEGVREKGGVVVEQHVIDVEPFVAPFRTKAFSKLMPDKLQKTFWENLYSEMRAVILSRVAEAHNCLLAGTGNYDEDYVLGYYTKRGDGAVDNNLLAMLPKSLVRVLAANLGVDSEIVNREPTAGLSEGQTDRGDLGYDYEVANEVWLEALTHSAYMRKHDREGVAHSIFGALKGHVASESVLDVLRRNETTEHKRKPPTIGMVSLELEENGKFSTWSGAGEDGIFRCPAIGFEEEV